ncbi:MAG TPA: VOC family protein [Gemmatimonadales bacterium]|nr:VOC family protein [Gemmatimonadales bacterium]
MTAPALPLAPYRIPDGTGLGHAHLRVSDLDRSIEFYCGVLGFTLVGRYLDSAAFVSAGDYHHHIGLNTWESKGASAPPPRHTGLYHLGIRYPTRSDLANAARRVVQAGIPLTGASDHGISVSVYLTDPDGIGLELTWDRPSAEWPRTPQGIPELQTSDPFDLDAFLEEEGG